MFIQQGMKNFKKIRYATEVSNILYTKKNKLHLSTSLV